MYQYFSVLLLFLVVSCKQDPKNYSNTYRGSKVDNITDIYDFSKEPNSALDSMLSIYTPFKLTANLNSLTPNELKMLPLLAEVANLMDDMYWIQNFGNRDSLLNASKNEAEKAMLLLNYGPWDKMNDEKPFLETYGKKPLGANFYPLDMTAEEFDTTKLDGKADLYTMIRRDQNGKLITIPYHVFFEKQLNRAAYLLNQAATLADDAGLKKYLELRAKALVDDQYMASDVAWLEMKSNRIDFIVGPIETYEDQLFGYKAAYESLILLKDMEWSAKLATYASYLPELQESLPVPKKYKAEKPGSNAQLDAYEVLYYKGAANTGGKTIAVNLPNDENIQLAHGSRRLQLKNVMKAKFDNILIPIAEQLIDSSQLEYISFEAFFENTMFHEVAHGLGIKNTITHKGSVREALKEHYSAIEEGKADILGIYMVEQLHKQGIIQGDIRSHMVTFMASIFRSVRFGASSAHGQANMIRFNYFEEQKAFTKDEKSGRYTVNFENFKKAIESLTASILKVQGDGDYTAAKKMLEKKGNIRPSLKKDLDRLTALGIPVDLVFEQGYFE